MADAAWRTCGCGWTTSTAPGARWRRFDELEDDQRLPADPRQRGSRAGSPSREGDMAAVDRGPRHDGRPVGEQPHPRWCARSGPARHHGDAARCLDAGRPRRGRCESCRPPGTPRRWRRRTCRSSPATARATARLRARVRPVRGRGGAPRRGGAAARHRGRDRPHHRRAVRCPARARLGEDGVRRRIRPGLVAVTRTDAAKRLDPASLDVTAAEPLDAGDRLRRRRAVGPQGQRDEHHDQPGHPQRGSTIEVLGDRSADHQPADRAHQVGDRVVR